MPRLDAIARHLLRGSDRNAARRADSDHRQDLARADNARSLETTAPFCRGGQGLLMGTTPTPGGGTVPVRLPQRIAHGLSSWVVGATGAGKTTAMTAWTMQDLLTPGVVTIALDFKGDYAEALTGTVIPYLVTHLAPEDGARLLTGLRVWAPWASGRRTIPSLHLTAPGGSIARRATALTDLFVATVGAGELGPRMLSAFVPSVKLLMRTGSPFALLPDVLTNDGFRSALLVAANDPELTAYFERRFQGDAREGVIYSILSRFDRFLSDDVTKLALFGPTGFDAADWLESGTTICDFGGGLRSHRAFWSTLTQTALLGAVLSRRTTRASQRVLMKIDEVAVALPTSDSATQLDEAVSLMRSRRAAVTVAHQHAGQLAEYPALLQSLRTNAWNVAFRVPEETANATACVLPEGLPPGVDGRGQTEATTKAAWMRALAALPDRTFLLRVPMMAPSSIPCRAPTLDLASLMKGVPREICDLAREGQDGHEPAELGRREQIWRRLVEELAATAEPNRDALRRLVDEDGDEAPTERPRRGQRRRALEVGT